MTDRQNQTRWVPEPIDEKTPVSVCPLRGDASLKDTEPPPPPVSRFNHPPISTRSRGPTPLARRSEPLVVLHPTLLDPIADPAQADTLLVARRLHVRRIGYFLVAFVSALFAAALLILVKRLT